MLSTSDMKIGELLSLDSLTELSMLSGEEDQSSAAEFADVLQSRVDVSRDDSYASGESWPADGKILPLSPPSLLDPPIPLIVLDETVQDVAVSDPQDIVSSLSRQLDALGLPGLASDGQTTSMLPALPMSSQLQSQVQAVPPASVTNLTDDQPYEFLQDADRAVKLGEFSPTDQRQVVSSVPQSKRSLYSITGLPDVPENFEDQRAALPQGKTAVHGGAVETPVLVQDGQHAAESSTNEILHASSRALGLRSEVRAAGERQPLPQALAVAVSEPGWGKAVSERVLLMANNKLQSAEINLTPAELGPIRVKLAIEDGCANVTFQAQHALTRDAIEQALPRLRELLAENGLMLGDTEVMDGDVRQGGQDEANRARAGVERSSHVVADADEQVERSHRIRPHNALVDTFV